MNVYICVEMEKEINKKMGRPRSNDKVVNVQIYVRKSIVDFYGGMDVYRKRLKELCVEYLERVDLKDVNIKEVDNGTREDGNGTC